MISPAINRWHSSGSCPAGIKTFNVTNKSPIKTFYLLQIPAATLTLAGAWDGPKGRAQLVQSPAFPIASRLEIAANSQKRTASLSNNPIHYVISNIIAIGIPISYTTHDSIISPYSLHSMLSHCGIILKLNNIYCVSVADSSYVVHRAC
jgi:hypothetical protein